MSESEQSRAANGAKAISNNSNKNWSKAAGLGLVSTFLGLGKNDRFADRGRIKTPQEWDNEIRAHELKTDINTHYGNVRADRDLERSNSHSDRALERAANIGRQVDVSEYNGKGGHKITYSDRQAAAEEAKEKGKKTTAKRGAKKPTAKKPTAKKPAAKDEKKPVVKRTAAKGEENPGMSYFGTERYP